MRKCFQKNANILLKKKIPKYIIDDIEIFFESDKENSDDGNSDKENSDEKILAKIQIKENSDEEDSSEEDFSEENSDEKSQFFSTYIDIIKTHVTIEEVIIQHIKVTDYLILSDSNYLIFKKSQIIRFVSRMNP